MITQSLSQACQGFASLLCHPQSDYIDILNRVIDSGVNKKAVKSLQTYQDLIRGLSVCELQEMYSRTFDLNPICSPALSVHLFGVESFKRSHLMVGLLDMYRTAGFAVAGETADHMSTVMQFLPIAASDEREEIMQFILLPGLAKIAEFLESKSSPYSYLIQAAISVLRQEAGKEASYV